MTVTGTVSTLPEGFAGRNATAEIYVHQSGKFVYASNRGHDSIAIFGIDAQNGALQPLGHVSTEGSDPRHFSFDKTGRYLLAANQSSDNVVVFLVDEASGNLTFTGLELTVDAPVCLLLR